MSYVYCSAGHLGCAVLQCGSKSLLGESVTIKINYFWARLVKKPTPNQIHPMKYAKNAIFHYLKMENTASAPALVYCQTLVVP